MKSIVRSYVRACKACQTCKPVYQKPQAYMMTTTSQECLELLACDYMGPMPESTPRKYQYLLVLVDHFSKFVMLYPVRHANSAVLCSIVNFCFCTFGPPVRFLSDNGPQFTCRRFQNFLKEWGVIQSFTTSYHPQSNFTERLNRNIKSMLACFHHQKHTEWAFYIPEDQFALNSVVHDTTKMSPAAIFFRREFNQPGDSAT